MAKHSLCRGQDGREVAETGFNFGEWDAQVLRLTVFLTSPYSEAPSLWQNLAGSSPESDETRPRETFRRQTGAWQDGVLEVQITDPRIDILATPLPSAGAPPAFAFGEFATQVGFFRDAIRPWLASAPLDCVRIAFGAVLVQKHPDRDSSYRRLAALVPSVKFNAATSREVFYRVNRPVPSRHIPSELNRMTSWSSVRTITAFVLDPSAAAGLNTFAGNEQNYARIECDNSTSADNKALFTPEVRVGIFDELVDLAIGNAKSGEQP